MRRLYDMCVEIRVSQSARRSSEKRFVNSAKLVLRLLRLLDMYFFGYQ